MSLTSDTLRDAKAVCDDIIATRARLNRHLWRGTDLMLALDEDRMAMSKVTVMVQSKRASDLADAVEGLAVLRASLKIIKAIIDALPSYAR